MFVAVDDDIQHVATGHATCSIEVRMLRWIDLKLVSEDLYRLIMGQVWYAPGLSRPTNSSHLPLDRLTYFLPPIVSDDRSQNLAAVNTV